MAYDEARDKIVLFGGESDAGKVGDTWERDGDGEVWRQIPVGGISPAARNAFAMTYDAARRQVVVFGGGGLDGLFRNDTWGWDGATWTQLSTVGPGVRDNHAMAYDRSRNRIVMFGGRAAGGNSRETWEWDGTQWVLVNTLGPSPRFGHAMTYDEVRNQVILFGGESSSPKFENGDTWAWNGSTWTRISSVGPSGRSTAMVFNAALDKTVLFGGQRENGILGDIWEWDGISWSQVSPNNSPIARDNHSMVYVASTGRTVLFGGRQSNPFAKLGDTWAWFDPSIPGPGSPGGLTPSHTFAFDETGVSNTTFTALPGGFSPQDFAAGNVDIGSLPSDSSFVDATNGRGLVFIVSGGQAAAVLGPVLEVNGQPVFIRASVRSNRGNAAVQFGVLPAISGSPDGSMELQQAVTSSPFANEWKRVTLLANPPSPATQVMPFIQVASINPGDGPTLVYIDNLEIYVVDAADTFDGTFIGADGTGP